MTATNSGMAVWHLGMGNIANHHDSVLIHEYCDTRNGDGDKTTARNLNHYSFYLAGELGSGRTLGVLLSS